MAKLTHNASIVWDYKNAVLVYSLGFYGKPVGLPRVQPNESFNRPLQLSLFDTLYLMEKGIITVWKDNTEVKREELIEFGNSIHEWFEEKYIVYKDFRERGYVVRSGLKFGVDFIVYEKGPGIDHSPFMVEIFFNKEEINPILLLRAGRLANTVNKSLVIATLEGNKPHYYVFKRFKA